jgi:diguanylate cyclase (GGDEF)-like protein
MWAAGLLGHVYHLNAAGAIDFRASLDGYIERIRLDRSGRLWIASNTGLYTLPRVPAGGTKPSTVPIPALRGVAAMGLIFDPTGDAWVGGDRGLFRIHDGHATAIALPGGRLRIATMARSDDDTWWLGGDFPGVLHIRVTGDKAHMLGVFARPQLASDFIQFLGVDHQKRVWIGTDNGVNVIEGSTVLHLSHQDGLIWNVCDGNAFYADSNGSIWLGTALGVSHLLDPDAALTRPPFAARIETARYKSVYVRAGSKLPWSGGALVVHFTGLTLRDNASLIYRYTLNGAETDAAITSQPLARFEGLRPGKYVLRVMAEDSGHKVFSSPAVLAFTLTPPWWRTPFFFALLGLLFTAMLRFAWRWRHNALLRRQKRLEALVESRTSELEQMASHDSLTGLRNRTAIFATLERERARARTTGEGLYVALIDIDHFKQVNDTLGHLAGDVVLREAAQRLSSSVRTSDAVGRYGGEEFLVVFRGATSLLGKERCEGLRRAVCEQPILWNQHAVAVTCSIGVACIESEAETIAELLTRADRALYRAKQLGRNRVEVAA